MWGRQHERAWFDKARTGGDIYSRLAGQQLKRAGIIAVLAVIEGDVPKGYAWFSEARAGGDIYNRLAGQQPKLAGIMAALAGDWKPISQRTRLDLPRQGPVELKSAYKTVVLESRKLKLRTHVCGWKPTYAWKGENPFVWGQFGGAEGILNSP